MKVDLAANNGDLGGGELMGLRIAEALAALGHDVGVVGPSSPAEMVDAAAARGWRTTAIRAADRRRYLPRLRAWDRTVRLAGPEPSLLWCNGLVPAFATAGHADRVVHLHQLPVGPLRAAARAAAPRARAVVVPSRFMADRIPGARVLPNWTPPVRPVPRERAPGAPLRIGFLGRFTTDKGADLLAAAVAELARTRRVEAVFAGDDRHVPAEKSAPVVRALDALPAGLVAYRGRMDPAAFFGAVDLAVFCSVWPEPFGLVAAEAMSARVPYVISDAGALPEVAGPGHRWVARAGDLPDLVRTLHAACDAIEAGATRPDVEAAFDRWTSHFSPPAGAAGLARLLRDLGLEPTQTPGRPG